MSILPLISSVISSAYPMGRVTPVARSASEASGGVAAISETKGGQRSLTAAKAITDILDLSPAAQQSSREEQSRVAQLKARDTEVRAHEQAHLATAGQYAKGGASYSYETGPDGQRYAVGGEVSIDSSPIKGDPDATMAKAQQIRAAALAPASPSGQDYKVAAAASEMEATARLQKTSSVEGKSRVGLGQAISPESPDGTKTAESVASSSAPSSSPSAMTISSRLIGGIESGVSDVAAAYLQQVKLSSRFSLFA